MMSPFKLKLINDQLVNLPADLRFTSCVSMKAFWCAFWKITLETVNGNSKIQKNILNLQQSFYALFRLFFAYVGKQLVCKMEDESSSVE